MSRFVTEMSRLPGQKHRDGTRARERESGHCPVPMTVPIPVPACPGWLLRMIIATPGAGCLRARLRIARRWRPPSMWRLEAN
jgi:hypothetical protein